MTPPYLTALIGSVLVLVAARIVVPALPIRGVARRIGRLDALLVLIGAVGLVLHCTAMFARAFAVGVPGVSALVGPIDAMGTASVLLFVAPAALLLVGLRRQWPGVPVVLLVALLAVGVTMYDGGPVAVHLAAILVAVVLLAAALLLLVSGIGRAGTVRGR